MIYECYIDPKSDKVHPIAYNLQEDYISLYDEASDPVTIWGTTKDIVKRGICKATHAILIINITFILLDSSGSELWSKQSTLSYGDKFEKW
jgi:hypothetical protein